jgi:hypothetical protein
MTEHVLLAVRSEAIKQLETPGLDPQRAQQLERLVDLIDERLNPSPELNRRLRIASEARSFYSA